MGPTGCPETSVRNYHYMLRNNPEEYSSHLLRGWNLKSRINNGCLLLEKYWTYQYSVHNTVTNLTVYIVTIWLWRISMEVERSRHYTWGCRSSRVWRCIAGWGLPDVPSPGTQPHIPETPVSSTSPLLEPHILKVKHTHTHTHIYIYIHICVCVCSSSAGRCTEVQ